MYLPNKSFHIFPTYPMVLVGGHRCELGLREDKSFEVLGCLPVLAGGVDVNHVKPRLVPVHRVQDHLQTDIVKLDFSVNLVETKRPTLLFLK